MQNPEEGAAAQLGAANAIGDFIDLILERAEVGEPLPGCGPGLGRTSNRDVSRLGHTL